MYCKSPMHSIISNMPVMLSCQPRSYLTGLSHKQKALTQLGVLFATFLHNVDHSDLSNVTLIKEHWTVASSKYSRTKLNRFGMETIYYDKVCLLATMITND
jgi:hypothetical protein